MAPQIKKELDREESLRYPGSSGDLLASEAAAAEYDLPASPPPWGKIIAVDIESPKKLWEISFGQKKSSDGKLIYGLQNFGGIMNTGSNIFFATGTTDENIYAFEVNDGKKIWQDKLPAAGSAPPMTFMYNQCQYIIVNSTGGRFFGFKKNLDATVAYKLNTCKAFGN